MVAFTRSLSANLAKRKIRVNAVAPGPVWTPLVASTFPRKKIATSASQLHPLGHRGFRMSDRQRRVRKQSAAPGGRDVRRRYAREKTIGPGQERPDLGHLIEEEAVVPGAAQTTARDEGRGRTARSKVASVKTEVHEHLRVPDSPPRQRRSTPGARKHAETTTR